jgi:hypothetical protein
MSRLVPWEDNYEKSKEELLNMIEIMNERQKASGEAAHQQFVRMRDLAAENHQLRRLETLACFELRQKLNQSTQELTRTQQALQRQLELYALAVTERADVQSRLDTTIETDRRMRALRDDLREAESEVEHLAQAILSKATRRELRESVHTGVCNVRSRSRPGNRQFVPRGV